MRAWRFHEFGDIENLRLEEVATPRRGEGDVLLEVCCASLNPADRYMVAGQYPRPAPRPFSVGRDCCGIVRETGPDSRFSPGDAVVLLASELGVSRTGTLAEFVTAPEACLAPLPEGWTVAEGAAAPLVFLTAWQALVDRGQLKPGQTVLITGASGGVGTAAVLLAKALGARVVALSRDETKRNALQRLGADWVVDSAPATLREKIKALPELGPIDLVVENLGGDYLDLSVRLVGYGGRIIVVGLLSGLEARVTLGLLIHKCVGIQGMSVNAYNTAEAQAAWTGIVKALNARQARPIIDGVFPFSEVQEGFRHLASGPLGKVCIMIGES